METVQIKYDNFRKSLDMFLHSIYERIKAEPGLTLQQITNKVLLQVGLQKSDFTTHICEYFLQISLQVWLLIFY
jgi:hypothetical protein